jgi:4-hydroxy-tetrahydrodipicolinate synthase
MEKGNSSLKGTGVALVTPLLRNGEIDFQGLSKVIDHVIKGGVNYIVSLGTTGETPTLSKEEKKELLKFTVEKVKKRVPIVVGIGGNNTKEVVDDMLQFDLDGVEAILSVAPYYNKPNQRGLLAHYQTIAAAAPRPIILYNVPGRTSSNLSAETTLQLAHEEENIIGVKEASGSFDQMMKIIKYKPANFLMISGDDLIALPLIASGSEGVISVIANAFPNDFSSMIHFAMKGDFSSAKKLHYQLDDFIRYIFADGSPAGVKYLMYKMNLCTAKVRLPLVKISAECAKQLDAELKKRK